MSIILVLCLCLWYIILVFWWHACDKIADTYRSKGAKHDRKKYSDFCRSASQYVHRHTLISKTCVWGCQVLLKKLPILITGSSWSHIRCKTNCRNSPYWSLQLQIAIWCPSTSEVLEWACIHVHACIHFVQCRPTLWMLISDGNMEQLWWTPNVHAGS